MKRVVFLLSILPVLALAASAGAAPAEEKLRVLVVTGGHAFDRKAFTEMFDSFDVSWREVAHPKANLEYAPDRRGTYDVIALYDMPKTIPDQEKAWLMETLREGKGLVVLHHAIGGYPTWPEYRRIVGGAYLFAKEKIGDKEWAPSTYQHDVELTIRIADPNHPITRGLKEFNIIDEVYGGYWVSPEVHPLLKVTHPGSSEVVGWTHSYGKARVVALQGGHDGKAYANESFRTLARRSLLWAAGRE